MEKNRFTTYLLYAIGEIILVVIGILIAVNINNWNQNKKRSALKEQLLAELVDELQYNIDRLQTLDNYSSISSYSVKAIDSLNKIRVELFNHGLDSAEIPKLFVGPIARFNAYNLNTFAFEQLKETGVLNELNPLLKSEIRNYYLYIKKQWYYIEIDYPRYRRSQEQLKYGFFQLKRDYFEDSTTYLSKHPWIFDTHSEKYSDLKYYIELFSYTIRNSRQRAFGIIEESQKLKELLLRQNPNLEENAEEAAGKINSP